MISKYAYLQRLIDHMYHDKYSDARTALHDSIIDSYFKDRPTTFNITHRTAISDSIFEMDIPLIIFMSGCYGAGKGHVLRRMHGENKINLDKFIYVDFDKIRTMLPEYMEYVRADPWTAGQMTGKESGYIAELIVLHALNQSMNIIVDGSLNDSQWYGDYFTSIKSMHPGYALYIIHVSAEWVDVLERNMIRAEQTKRCIPLQLLKQIFANSTESFDKLKYLADQYIEIHN
jgi:hypothetical protein